MPDREKIASARRARKKAASGEAEEADPPVHPPRPMARSPAAEKPPGKGLWPAFTADSTGGEWTLRLLMTQGVWRPKHGPAKSLR